MRNGSCMCGAVHEKHDWIGVVMGAFDDPTNTHIEIHIYVGEKGDYYEVTDGVPQVDTVPDHVKPSPN